MFHINTWMVLAVALINFFIGFLLHGPIGGKLWMKLANVHPTGHEKFSDMVPQMLQNYLVNIIFVYAFSVIHGQVSFSPLVDGNHILNGMKLAAVVWAGFICTTTSIEVIWMGRSVALWAYEAACSLIVCLTMGAIVAAW